MRALLLDDRERRGIGAFGSARELVRVGLEGARDARRDRAAARQLARGLAQRLTCRRALAERRIGIGRAADVDELGLDLLRARVALRTELGALVILGLRPRRALADEPRRLLERRPA